MQRSHLLALFAVCAATALLALLFFRNSGPDIGLSPSVQPEVAPVPALGANGATAADAATQEAASRRREIEPDPAGESSESDPEVRAALSGFRGRVVDHRGEPVADRGVRIYRFAVDSVLPAGVDLFEGTVEWEPQYLAGESTTGTDGSFLIGGVWPRAFYLLHAGIGSDAPSHRVLPHAPGPGEILDLGDIVLNDAAVLTGRVVDEDGEPIEGAMVRTVDLPGEITAFMPIERFDPDGCILLRDNAPTKVIELPAWVRRAWDHLPVPTTLTDADGAFRLTGVVAGSNMLAVTSKDHLAYVRSGIRIDAGEEKALGELRLDEGEELFGRVVDSKGEPVAGAEVVAGPTLPGIEADIASHVGPTDAEGNFHALGFPSGRVTVAARRSPRDPWCMVEPQLILQDVVVTLPAAATLTLRVLGVDGAVAEDPQIKLMSAKRTDEAVVMATLGMLRAIDIDERSHRLEDGSLRIDDLSVGGYVVVATAPGAGWSTEEVELGEEGKVVTLQLEASIAHRVRVLGPGEKPIRSARVYVEERGAERRRNMPFCAGRTGGDGLLEIHGASTPQVRVSVSHPRWGTMHGEIERLGVDLVLRMQQPGWIEGVMLEGGKPVAPGRYTVAGEWRPGSRGPLEDTPLLATPDREGRFGWRALQPGRYSISAISSLEALKSPGSVLGLAKSMMMANSMPRESVEVVAGQGSQVELRVGEEDYTGPVGSVFGFVQIDGRAARGAMMVAHTVNGRKVVETDEGGRYEFAALPVGDVRLTMSPTDDTLFFDNNPLFFTRFEMAAGEAREVDIDVRTTWLEGVVLLPTGAPAADTRVRLRRRAPASEGGGGMDGWSGSGDNETTDADGHFRFESQPEGVFELEVDANSGRPCRGRLEGIRAASGAPATGLRLELVAAAGVKGRIDGRVFATKPDWSWIEFRSVDQEAPGDPRRGDHVAGVGVRDDYSFETYELEAGSYNLIVHASVDGTHGQYTQPHVLEVPPQGLSDVVISLSPLPDRNR